MCSQQENSGTQTLANSATVRLATSYWGILIHMTRITSLRWQHFQSGSCLKCPINLAEFCLRSNVCNQFSADCTSGKLTDTIDGAHTHLSVRRLGASVDRQRYLQVWYSLQTFVLGNHKFLQTANKHGLLHASNIRRQFRRATDNSHWHHASHSLHTSDDLVLFLTTIFKHRLMNYSARAYY
jgi:hypothetical protein